MGKISIWVSLGIAIVIVAVLVLFTGLHSSKHTRTVRDVNTLLVIAPYKYQGTWVFDDPAVGLSREPFIAGIDTMIDKAVADIPNAEKGFRAIFSASPFPGVNWKLDWRREESGGNWYYSDRFKMEGWLCPALLKYFPTAPREIYVKIEPKN
ncbi:MAG: hypothetical protein QOF93_567 [Verrucomicrobiota bacterium]|jgi:hypothetical protein